MTKNSFLKYLDKRHYTLNDLTEIFAENRPDFLKSLYEKSSLVKNRFSGSDVYLRGIIEYSNICEKNCFYCGIRKDNKNVIRYTLSDKEVIDAALFAYESGYGSVVLQGGELKSSEFIKKIETLIQNMKKETDYRLGITLSFGEQNYETLTRWFDAGAHRYLLRIETSRKELYQKLHPTDHDFEVRVEAIKNLKRIGYQTGTGMLIGVPGQTEQDVAEDILFMKKYEIDMVGMGPYIPHKDTPLSQFRQNDLSEFVESNGKITKSGFIDSQKFDKENQLTKALKTIAITRLVLKDVNIAAATALQALDPLGREKGIAAGANIVMPNITPVKYRKNYQLYEDKPCLNEREETCKKCLEERLKAINCVIGYNFWGDSIRYQQRGYYRYFFSEDEYYQKWPVIEETLKQLNYGQQEIQKIKISVSEMIINSLTHGHKNLPDESVEVFVKPDTEKVLFEIKDHGPGFKRPQTSADSVDRDLLEDLFLPDLKDDSYAHGRGIFITRKYMDSVKFNAEGNKVTLIKYNQLKKH